MSVHAATYPTLINGEPVSTTDLVPLAFSGFAHFTAMQVRDRKVKGLDLHLTRLREASIKLYGMALPDEKILRSIRRAIAEGSADMSLTATMFSPEGEFTAKSMGVEPTILVRSDSAYDGPSGPVRLWVVEHERYLAQIKHVGEGAKTRPTRLNLQWMLMTRPSSQISHGQSGFDGGLPSTNPLMTNCVR